MLDCRKQLHSAHLSGINTTWRGLSICSLGVILLMKSEGSVEKKLIYHWINQKHFMTEIAFHVKYFSLIFMFCLVFLKPFLTVKQILLPTISKVCSPWENYVWTFRNFLKVFFVYIVLVLFEGVEEKQDRWKRQVGWQATLDLKPSNK